MIGYCHYPYVIVALLPIYTHSTNQMRVFYDPEYTAAELRKEKPGLLGTPGKYGDVACDKLVLYEKQQICEDTMRDVVAEKPLTVTRGAELYRRYKRIRVGKFLDEKSSLPVPLMASPGDPYTCRKIEIEGLGYEKRMFWCPNRVFTLPTEWHNYGTASSGSASSESDTETARLVPTNDSADSNWNTNSNWVTNSNESTSEIKTAEVAGFFLAGSGRYVEDMFALKPSSTNGRKVTAWAALTQVKRVREASLRC